MVGQIVDARDGAMCSVTQGGRTHDAGPRARLPRHGDRARLTAQARLPR